MNRSLWKFLTSLRVTIVLLGLAIGLVFFGTVAQADEGLFQVQDRYFRHWYVLGTTLWGYHMPWFVWPGGRAIGTCLVVNLLAAHIKRFQWSMSKVGIHLTHIGIIILLVGQLATDLLQAESRIVFNEGETGNFIESHQKHELAFVSDSGDGRDQVVAIPEAMLAKGREITSPKLPFTIRVTDYAPNSDLVSHTKVTAAADQIKKAFTTLDAEFSSAAALPALAEHAQESEGRVQVWRDALVSIGETDNTDIVAAAKKVAATPERATQLLAALKTRFKNQMMRAMAARTAEDSSVDRSSVEMAVKIVGAGKTLTPDLLPPAATNGMGTHATVTPEPEVKDMDSTNFPFAVLEVLADGKSLGTWLVSPTLRDQDLSIGGKIFHTSLRQERQYLPFSLKLIHATHKVYPGSDIPKDFRSRMLISNPETKENREVEISMNDPLRYSGLAFYQYQMSKDEFDRAPGSSTLQVVHNPSWLAPYIGCIVVAAGMIWQFLHHLVGFITKRRPA